MGRWLREAHFVDRRSELARLDAALRSAAADRPSVVVVGADAGVGKTRLLEEFASRVVGRVLWGGCLPLGERGLPFAPVAEALRHLDDEPELTGGIPAPLATLVSGGGDPHHEHVLSRSQLFQAVLGLLEDLAERATTVLVLEDLHWADPSTRDLLTFLVPNLRRQRLLVMGSYRTDDLERDHALRPVLAELARHPHVQRLDVRPFTDAQIAEQLTHLTGRLPTPDALRRVAARTQGNAYFVEELVAAGLDERDLPASLRELLLVRADRVSPAARRLLRIASLAERSVRDALLAEVSDTPIAEVRSRLHEAVDGQLLVSTPQGVRFRHALLREVLQHDLLAGERREYHAAYARALRQRGAAAGAERAATVAELAHHLHEAGDTTDAMGAWIEAADAAEAVFAFAEAHQHLSRALAAWDTADDPVRRAGCSWVQLVARTAEDAFLGGDAARACALARAALAAVDETRDARLAGVLYERLSRYLVDSVDREQVRAAIEQAVHLVPASPPSEERARVLAGWGGRLMMRGRLRDSRRVSEEAVAMAREVGAALVECTALNTLGAVCCYLDDVDAGLAQIERALALARDSGDAHQQLRAYWNRAVCRTESGRWAEAIDLYRTAIKALPRLGLAHQLPELYMYVAHDLVCLGRWDEARAAVTEAAERFPSRADEAVPIELVIGTDAFDEARRLISVPGDRVFGDEEGHAMLLVNLAEMKIWEGDHDGARAAVDEVMERMLHTDRPIAVAKGVQAGMRCEADVADEAHARRRPDLVDVARARGAALHAHIRDIVDRPGPDRGWKREVRALAAICDGERSRLDGSPDPAAWADAVELTRALSRIPLDAYSQFRQSEAIMATSGDRYLAATHARQAHEAARSMGARPLQQLIERFARRARLDIGTFTERDVTFGLTPREREVLTLLVQGATNRQIAERLFITEKTASVHVSNIIRKLGVSNRGEAAATAHRTGLVSA